MTQHAAPEGLPLERSAAEGSEQTAQKRGNLHGGALTEEALASSRTVLSPARGNRNAFVGLQQWFTPPEAANLTRDVVGRSVYAVLDPTAGSGALLEPFDAEKRFGIEIDADHIPKRAKSMDDGALALALDPDADDEGAPGGTFYQALNGDAQRVVPMLRAAGLRWPAVVANPPFGLSWRDPIHAKGTINSGALAYLWALDLLAPDGQGALILGRDRLAREVLGRPEARGVYAIVDVEGALFDGVALPCSIAFFVRPENRRGDAPPARFASPREELHGLAEPVRSTRYRTTSRVSLFGHEYGREGAASSLHQAFGFVRREAERRAAERADERAKKRGRFDATLKGRRVSVSLSGFAQLALAKEGSLRTVELLSGNNVASFGQNPRSLNKLEDLASRGLLTLDPALLARARQAVEEAVKVATPLMRLKEQMRLGWLTDLDKIRCIQDDPDRGFFAGNDYALATSSEVVEHTESRAVEKRNGEHELRKFTTERKLLRITIGRYDNSGNRAHAFDEGPESIAYITEHFDLPDPGSIADTHPEEVERNRRILLDIEREYRFREKGKPIKPFQLDHLSRLLVKGRGLLAHDPGLGKTLQQMLIAKAMERLGKASPQAIFTCPQDLIEQTQLECEFFFGHRMQEISNPQQARRVAEHVEENPDEFGWYITYYECLSLVGRRQEPLPEGPLNPREALRWRLYEHKKRKHERAQDAYERDPENAPKPPDDLPKVGDVFVMGPTTRDACPRCGADADEGWDGEVCRRPKRCVDHGPSCKGTGEGHAMKGCGYVHRKLRVKTAASHLSRAFRRGVKCVDEVAEIRGDDSLRSKAVRALASGAKNGGGAHNFGATGTPMSNYINDCFQALLWTLGAASVAFPYDHSGKAAFERDYCVIEHRHGRDQDGEEHLKQRRKILPQITNVSQFWRMVQPSVSRCRKDQTGEPLVSKTYHPIRVPLGVNQRAQVQFWLNNFASYFCWKNPEHPFVKENLVELFQAALGMGWRLEAAATLPAWDEPTREYPRARAALGTPSNWTPATLKTLEIAMMHVANGEKVLIGSDLLATGKFLSECLQEKGVKAVNITEERAGKTVTKTPRKRSREIRAFADGDAQVLCAGLQAMKLGHNLTAASAVIINGLDWSHMVITQFLDRVHRLTSIKPVNVYVIIPAGTIAERKWGLLKDKGGTADLAFDGELYVQPEKPINLNKVLEEMKKKGIAPTGEEVPEAEIEAAWRETAPLNGPGGIPWTPEVEAPIEDAPILSVPAGTPWYALPMAEVVRIKGPKRARSGKKKPVAAEQEQFQETMF